MLPVLKPSKRMDDIILALPRDSHVLPSHIIKNVVVRAWVHIPPFLDSNKSVSIFMKDTCIMLASKDNSSLFVTMAS